MLVMVNLLISLLGIIAGLIAVTFLGRTNLTRKQWLLIFILCALPFVFFLIFGLFDYSLSRGPELDFGAFQISNGISESLLILLVFIVPVLLSVLLMIFMKNFRWIKRLAIPFLLGLTIVGLNFYQTFREYEEHKWDHERGYYYSCPTNEANSSVRFCN